MEQKKLTGTIRVYGCPAEEGGSGKVYMVREGLFNDVDVVIHWHPNDENAVTMTERTGQLFRRSFVFMVFQHMQPWPRKEGEVPLMP